MAQKVAIIDYGSGNLHSVGKAVERAAAACGLGLEVSVTADAEVVRRADRLILPGVGAFRACYDGLVAVAQMVDAIEDVARRRQRPFLGICVGMQLLAERGLEFGETSGLGWIEGEVRALTPNNPDLCIPHMGWNTVTPLIEHPLFPAAQEKQDFYFVHSYHFDSENKADVAAECDYGGAFAAAVARDNIVGVQFHPEKSQAAGLRFLERFLAWSP